MKALTLVVVATFALFAQAASVAWSSESYGLVDENGTKLTSYAGSGEIVLVLLGTDTENFSDATYLQSATISAASKSKGRVYGKYEFKYGSSTQLSNGDILAVLYKTDGNYQKLLTAGADVEMYKTFTVSGLVDDTWAGAYAYATSNFQEPIPEPTSGLLLLVGASLLALRRKQK